jgi:hypothetical protein
MMSISPPAYTGYTALLELLTHHCDIVETETKVGRSKIAPVVSHLGATVGHKSPSGRDLDEMVAQRWFCAAVTAHSTVPHATSNMSELALSKRLMQPRDLLFGEVKLPLLRISRYPR